MDKETLRMFKVRQPWTSLFSLKIEIWESFFLNTRGSGDRENVLKITSILKITKLNIHVKIKLCD